MQDERKNNEMQERKVETMTAIAYVIVFSILAFESYPMIKAGLKK